MQPMSGFGPTGDDNPFEGLPFFGDLGRMLGGMGGGGVQWEQVRQVAMQIASGGRSEPNVDPTERIAIEELGRVADLHVADRTGLRTATGGGGITVVPVTRTQWVARSADAYRPLIEALAGSIGAPPAEAEPDLGMDGNDALSAMLGQLMRAMSPMMLSVTAGGMLGHLATRSFGQYDLPVPRAASDELALVLPNVDEFGAEWSIPPADLRLWLCVHEITHHAVLAVPHVRAALETMIGDYAAGFAPDPTALVDRLGAIDPSGADGLAALQSAFGDPEVMLGALQSDAQRALLPRLDALVAVIVGYVDHVMDDIGGRLLGNYAMITEALRRRRVEADESDRFVSRLFGLEVGQATYDRGAAFVDGVVERADFDALDALWRGERFLPTPAEIEAPGLWLARLEFDD